MKKILICNQKGGVGKSLIADELTFSFERSNISAAFLDLNDQGGTLHETNQRMAWMLPLQLLIRPVPCKKK